MDNKIMNFRMPGQIWAGNGALEKLKDEAAAVGAKRALLVTDKGVVSSGLDDKIRSELKKAGMEVDTFDRVISDPDIACAEACTEMAQKGDYGLIVGLGGGSPMDIAAVAAVMCTNSGRVADYLGINLVKNPGIPTILIPTTAGTGAEVTPNAILTDTEEKLKKAVVSPYILPKSVILDPLLTVTMPDTVTSSTGIDALTHSIECYTSNKANIMSDLFARDSIIRCGRSLRTAVADGNNLEARYDMAVGSLYGGIAITNAGVTAVHALAYPLGGQFGVPHGVANGLLLPFVMEFNTMGNIPKFAEIAGFMGEKVERLPLLEQARRAAKAVRALYQDLKIPQSLTELGVPNDAIQDMAQAAMQVTRLMDNNPRRMTVDDVVSIYEKAL